LESNIFFAGIKTPLGETYVPDGLSEADLLAVLLQHVFSVPKGEGLMFALPHQSINQNTGSGSLVDRKE
jgi:hypothetical protein